MWAVTWVDYANSESCYVLLERWNTTADPKFTRVYVLPANTTSWTTTGKDWHDANRIEFEVYAATKDARSPSGTTTLERGMP